MNFDLFARPGSVGWLDWPSIDADVTFLHQPLNRSAGNGWKSGTEPGVEPLGGQRPLDSDDFRA